MKVAILGNMNNNGFALLRYFRDLGVEAYLLLFSGDGLGKFAHFDVDADTWQYDRWKNFVIRTKVHSGYKAVYGDPKGLSFPVTKRYLSELIEPYDFVLSSGSAPALFAQRGLSLDGFFPYAIGVEYMGSGPTLNRLKNGSWLVRLIVRNMVRLQRKGIQDTRLVFNADVGRTEDNLNKAGIYSKKLAIPMLYVESNPIIPAGHRVNKLVREIENHEFVVFSHARQLWVKKPSYSDHDWLGITKNSDWLIRGFSQFISEHSVTGACLVLLEYGQDVAHSKKLVNELGLADKVIWLPLMQRKEIMFLLSKAHVGVGEFYNLENTLWGGTGWEVLAAGKPLLQSLRFEKGQFEKELGYEPPKLLNVEKKDCVCKQLLYCYQNRGDAAAMGIEGRNWFHKHNGQNLAQAWLDVIREEYGEV